MKDCDLRHVILRIFPRTFQPITMKFNNHVTDGMMEKQRQCGRKRNHGPSLGLRLKILFNLSQKFYLNETWQFWSDCKRIETPNKNKPGKTKKMFIQYSFLADRTFSVFTTSSKCLPEVKKKPKKPKTFILSADPLVNAVSVAVASRHSKGGVAIIGGVGGHILTQRHGLLQLGRHCRRRRAHQCVTCTHHMINIQPIHTCDWWTDRLQLLQTSH